MAKFSSDRRAVTAIEYALLAGVIGLVLVEVLQVPAHAIADMVGQLFAGAGGSGGGGSGTSN